jgi:AcrR family transcriptional regulator
MNLAVASPTSSPTTKDRILDVAERLFSRDGIDATSLRTITAEADVNLAAVNYHFQSKDALVRAVLARRIEPVNRRRLELLARFEAEAAPEPVPLARLIEAFVTPVVSMKREATHFVPMMARMYTEQRSFVEQVFEEHFRQLLRRFIAAFQRSLPGLPEVEVIWRIHYMVAALIHTLAAQRLIHVMSQGACETENVDAINARLIAFFTFAFEAPVPEIPHAH